MPRVVVIGNPSAGRGALAKQSRRILGPLGDAELRTTEEAGHAVQLARDARRAGTELVVAAGGDGTVHEVVNGLLADGPGDGVPTLGIVPLGSGCDYVKTFDIPQDVDGAVLRLAQDAPTRAVDVGHVTYDGAERYFANIAEVGIGPEIVDRAARLPRVLGPAVYFGAFWLTLPRYARREARITTGEGARGDETWRGPLMDLVIAVGRVFGGGMRIAPKADPSDGMFDIQVHFGSKADYVRSVPKVYRGTHLPHPRVLERRAAAVEIDCEPPGLIEADGEVLGRTPATFRIVPNALRLKA
jgi:diacylglycerol kinase (ATP)